MGSKWGHDQRRVRVDSAVAPSLSMSCVLWCCCGGLAASLVMVVWSDLTQIAVREGGKFRPRPEGLLLLIAFHSMDHASDLYSPANLLAFKTGNRFSMI